MRTKYGIKHYDTPAMELTTMVGCPLMCTFCPQDNLRETYGDRTKYMQLDDLKVMLERLPKNTRIDFSGMSEPWANPACTDMLRLTLDMGFDIAIYSTLYGMTDPEVVRDLLESHKSQVKVLTLHLPDANGNMKGWKLTDEWLHALTTLSYAKLDTHIDAMTMDRNGVVHPSLKELVPKLSGWVGHTRADSLNVEQVKGQEISITPHNTFALTCASTPFYDRNVLLPNGDVVLCCMDYDLKHIIGNLLDQTYEEMMQGEKLAQIIKMNEADGFDKCSICKSCENVRKI
jgi:radical SAM protein with 4Fe4S-binding SPASM domain